jgi:hypothetical protein
MMIQPVIKRSGVRWVMFVVTLCLAPHARGGEPAYDYTILAQTGQTIGWRTLTSITEGEHGYQRPAFNNVGQVVFGGGFAGGFGLSKLPQRRLP